MRRVVKGLGEPVWDSGGHSEGAVDADVVEVDLADVEDVEVFDHGAFPGLVRRVVCQPGDAGAKLAQRLLNDYSAAMKTDLVADTDASGIKRVGLMKFCGQVRR